MEHPLLKASQIDLVRSLHIVILILCCLNHRGHVFFYQRNTQKQQKNKCVVS
nr:MAG TPA: hypothetical protein [Caudoviricetes sp.]